MKEENLKNPRRGVFVVNKLDEYFLKKTFDLARKGTGVVSPNPLVGACVVKEGTIVGEGYHRGVGTPHAEVEALKKAGDNARGATLYVSLEPCAHHGKTPPCTEAIEASGILRVVAPIKDSNPLVNGNGFKYLKSKGIEVTLGILAEEARELNSFYLKYIKTKIPFVILKAAVTLDGKIGDPERGIFRISGEESHMEVHRIRNSVDAVLIGAGTVITDDPSLTVRKVKAVKQPHKIIIDPELKCPGNARIFKDGGKVILVTTNQKAKEKYPEAEIWDFKKKNGEINIKDILEKAGEEKISSIMVEGGSETFTLFVKSGMVDKYLLFFSPSFIGKGVSLINSPLERVFFDTSVRKMGKDILIEANNVYRNN
jgi:diaminohydroxyphosphoribosylaminopyrimidine deaminase/5-amino-6-(5-phosphoribosylamino)uracil reductase